MNLNPGQKAALELLQRELNNLEQTIDDLYHMTLSVPATPAWEHVRQLVTCLDATTEVMQQTLDLVKEAK